MTDAAPQPGDPTDRPWAVVVAAGSGRRFGGDKLAARLGDATVLDRSIATARSTCGGVVVVVRRGHPFVTSPPLGVTVVVGGASRSASVRIGLAAIPDDVRVVLVHDAARPLADRALYRRVVDALDAGAVAVVPVVSVVDTIRSVDGGTVPREGLRAVQTPQGFTAEVLRGAHAGDADATDDATLVEALGHRVTLVDGDVRNLKVTTPADLVVARALLEDWRDAIS